MNAFPPTIPGSGNLQTLSVQKIDIETLNAETVNAETVNAETVNASTSVSSRLTINLSGVSNNFIAYSGTGSIIKGNDTSGQVNFDVLTTSTNQFRLIFNTPYSTPPIVILTQESIYIGETMVVGESGQIPITVNVVSTTHYFTIILPYILSINLLPGNITVNYMVIGTI